MNPLLPAFPKLVARILIGVWACMLVGCEQQQSPTSPSEKNNDSNQLPQLHHESAHADESLPITKIRLQLLGPELFPEVIPDNGEQYGYATILESLGSGCGALDYDMDGLTDCILAGGGNFDGREPISEPLYLLRNQRLRFVDRTAQANFSSPPFYHHGIAIGDFDHDGFQDVVVTGYNEIQLYRNLGDGTWSAEEHNGLDSNYWNSSAGWADVNHDGHLDLYVCTYVDWSFDNDPPCFASDNVTRDNCSPKVFNPQPDQLFLNQADGSFRNATSELGLRPDGKALGIVAADLDEDGAIDLYVGNDVMSNFLYRTTPQGALIDESAGSGAGVSHRGTPDASMGVNVVDFDLDGQLDLWAANFEMESFALYRQQTSLLFRHMSEVTGVSAIGNKYVGWGSVFSDLDHDGDEDLLVCNGHVVRHPDHAPVQQRMVLLENMAGEYFHEVTEQAGDSLNTPRNSRGLALIDWNNDGRTDLLFSAIHSRCGLLENRSESNAHWLKLRLIGTRSPRLPVGTRVEWETEQGIQVRILKGGGSYASASDTYLLFTGLSQTTPTQLKITWPHGESQMVSTMELDSQLVIVESLQSDDLTTIFKIAP